MEERASKVCSRGRGEYYATTSMCEVELILEFNFVSGSSFLSRLVRQVISVPLLSESIHAGHGSCVV